ncbi:hypothetical protein [Luteipulveratus halotolerans]|nr:hypothetical protein [Luteipulveratus halotolerans]
MSARRTTATMAAALLALTFATTACSKDDGGGGDGGDAQAIPTAWSAQDATNTSDQDGDQQAAPNRKAIPATEKWTLKLAPESGSVAYADWPDAQQLYPRDRIQGLFPEATKLEQTSCAFGQYGNGNQTPKNATCSWYVTNSTERYVSDNDKSTFRIKLRGIGADSEVTKSWDSTRDQFRTEKKDGDVFYKDGTFGARRALFRDSTGLGSFVISDGQIAAWIDLEFTDFSFVSPQDQTPGKIGEVIRKQVFPLAIQDLIPHLPRQYS